MKLYYISFDFNILQFFFLLSLLSAEASFIENDNYEDGNNTGGVTLLDLRVRNVDIEEELDEMIKTILQNYQEIKDFYEKPFINLAVVLPKDFDQEVVTETLEKVIDQTLSNIIPADQSNNSEALFFSMQVRNEKYDYMDIQNITVTFELSNETLECLEHSIQENDTTGRVSANLWCSHKIAWVSNNETEDETDSEFSRIKPRKMENLSIIDMSDRKWVDRLNSIIGENMNSGKNEITQLDINLLPPRNFHYANFQMMLKHTNDLINQRIEGVKSVKYLVHPRKHGMKLRDLSMKILLGPLDDEEEENEYVIKKMCVDELIPPLQVSYKNYVFKYESIFNAVEINKDPPSRNSYRVVIRVYKRGNNPKIPFVVIRNAVLEMRMQPDYKDIRFTSCYNEFDYKDPTKDYLILTFEVMEPTFEDTEDVVENTLNKLVSNLERTNPNQRLETSFRRRESTYLRMCDVDQYEAFIWLLNGVPTKISTSLKNDILGQLSRETKHFKITCSNLEPDPDYPKLQVLKLCFDVKNMKENCSNQWSSARNRRFRMKQPSEVPSV